MNNKLKKRLIALILSSLMIVSLCSCSKEKAVNGEAQDEINVTVYEVTKDNINSTADYTGEILGAETTAVSAKVSGEAEYIAVQEGDYVNAGDTLLTIDRTTYQLAYNQASAQYKSAQASYNSVTGGSTKQSVNQLETALNAAKIAYDNALDIYNKQKTLYDMGAISQIEFNTYKTNLDNAKLNYDSAKTNYELTKDVVVNETKESAKAGVEQAKAALDIAANNLNNCVVTAPISGYISLKNVNRGQMVAQGVALFTITDTSSVEIKINVTEAVIPLMTVGASATVKVSSVSNDEIMGTVSSFNPVKDAKTGLYTVKISVPNPDGALKEGMFASINLLIENRSDILTVPVSSVIKEDESETYVYVVNGNIAEKRVIETGLENDEYIEIISGLETGEKVVLSGKEYISEENNTVRIVEE